jgi:hypothetical protein
MQFRVSCNVDDLTHKMCDEPITYDLVRSVLVHVSIRKQTPTYEPTKIVPVVACCTTTLELRESDGLHDLIEGMTRSKDGTWANFEGMNGKMKGIYEVVDPVFQTLGADLRSSIAILKWRYGITDSPVNSMSNWSEAVSLDGVTWRSIGVTRSVKISFLGILKKVDSSAVQEVGRLHNEGVEPPLGLQLINEARNQRMTHPRSALVIGVTAAEIAIKQLIGDLAPDARWLAENVPSPPIVKIVKDYIPNLKVKAHFTNKPLLPPKQLRSKLDHAVQLRNKVVHAGEAPPGPDELKEVLDAMEDVIWICVLYSGQPWAGHHISNDTMSAWADEG